MDVDPAAELPQQGGDTFKCDICGNAFKSENGLRIHKGKSHKGSELPQCEKIRDTDIELSLNVSPVKYVREEVTNLQVFECDECGEKFESEDTLDTHSCQNEQDLEQDEVPEMPIICGCGCGASERCPRHYELIEVQKQMVKLMMEQMR